MDSAFLIRFRLTFGPVFRSVPLWQCIDATGASFSVDGPLEVAAGDRSLHPYTAHLLDNAAEATPPGDVTPPGDAPPLAGGASRPASYRVVALTDLFPELAATAPDHPAHSLPADTHLTPWFRGDIGDQVARTRRVVEREFPEIENPVNPLFGGMGHRQAGIEKQRGARIYESIRDTGFRQSRRRGDAIQGVLLTRRDGDQRFFVMAGKHRVAALAAVRANLTINNGDRWFPSAVTVRLRRPGVIRERDVDRWPLVASGFWPRAAALSYFDRLFAGRACFA